MAKRRNLKKESKSATAHTPASSKSARCVTTVVAKVLERSDRHREQRRRCRLILSPNLTALGS